MCVVVCGVLWVLLGVAVCCCVVVVWLFCGCCVVVVVSDTIERTCVYPHALIQPCNQFRLCRVTWKYNSRRLRPPPDPSITHSCECSRAEQWALTSTRTECKKWRRNALETFLSWNLSLHGHYVVHDPKLWNLCGRLHSLHPERSENCWNSSLHVLRNVHTEHCTCRSSTRTAPRSRRQTAPPNSRQTPAR